MGIESNGGTKVLFRLPGLKTAIIKTGQCNPIVRVAE